MLDGFSSVIAFGCSNKFVFFEHKKYLRILSSQPREIICLNFFYFTFDLELFFDVTDSPTLDMSNKR